MSIHKHRRTAIFINGLGGKDRQEGRQVLENLRELYCDPRMGACDPKWSSVLDELESPRQLEEELVSSVEQVLGRVEVDSWLVYFRGEAVVEEGELLLCLGAGAGGSLFRYSSFVEMLRDGCGIDSLLFVVDTCITGNGAADGAAAAPYVKLSEPLAGFVTLLSTGPLGAGGSGTGEGGPFFSQLLGRALENGCGAPPAQPLLRGSDFLRYFQEDIQSEAFEGADYKPYFEQSGATEALWFARNVHSDMEVEEEDVAAPPPVPGIPKLLTGPVPGFPEGGFAARQAELQKLRRQFTFWENIVQIHGVDGVGKRSLAAAYVHAYGDAYQHIAWIRMDSSDPALDFVTAEGLRENLGIKTASGTAEELFDVVIGKLGALVPGPCLLVLDNVGEILLDLEDLLPQKYNWDVLAISREGLGRYRQWPLGQLGEEDAQALFRSHCPEIVDAAGLGSLLDAVGRHALTVTVLAKAAAHLPLDIAALQAAVDRAVPLRRKGKGSRSDQAGDVLRGRLAAILDLHGISEGEQWLLKQLLCLPARDLGYGLLQELLGPGAADRGEDMSLLLRGLADKGWLQGEAGAPCRLHPLLAMVAGSKLKLQLGDVMPLLLALRERLHIQAGRDRSEDTFVWEPFGRALAARFDKVKDLELADFQNELGIVQRELGDYGGAIGLWKKALASYDALGEAAHPNIASLRANMALGLQAQGHFPEAKALLEQALAAGEGHFGPEHPVTVRRATALALVLRDMGELLRAKELLERGLAWAVRTRGEKDREFAEAAMHLATVLLELGDFPGAKALLERSLPVDERTLGPEHYATASGYWIMAAALENMGDLKGAEAYCKKALKGFQASLPEGHPDIEQLSLYMLHLMWAKS